MIVSHAVNSGLSSPTAHCPDAEMTEGGIPRSLLLKELEESHAVSEADGSCWPGCRLQLKDDGGVPPPWAPNWLIVVPEFLNRNSRLADSAIFSFRIITQLLTSERNAAILPQGIWLG